MTDYAWTLAKRYASHNWTLNGDDYDGLQWLSDAPKPTRAELDTACMELRAEREAEQIAREQDRVSARGKLAALGLTEAEIVALLGS